MSAHVNTWIRWMVCYYVLPYDDDDAHQLALCIRVVTTAPSPVVFIKHYESSSRTIFTEHTTLPRPLNTSNCLFYRKVFYRNAAMKRFERIQRVRCGLNDEEAHLSAYA